MRTGIVLLIIGALVLFFLQVLLGVASLCVHMRTYVVDRGFSLQFLLSCRSLFLGITIRSWRCCQNRWSVLMRHLSEVLYHLYTSSKVISLSSTADCPKRKPAPAISPRHRGPHRSDQNSRWPLGKHKFQKCRLCIHSFMATGYDGLPYQHHQINLFLSTVGAATKLLDCKTSCCHADEQAESPFRKAEQVSGQGDKAAGLSWIGSQVRHTTCGVRKHNAVCHWLQIVRQDHITAPHHAGQ